MKIMNRTMSIAGALFIGGLAICGTMRVATQELPKVYDASVPHERQIALAESAAPAEVSSKATVYILGPKGYEKVREGTNGFSCFVGRSFVKPSETTVEPGCFDAEGSRTTLVRRIYMEELRANCKSEAEIKEEIAKGSKEGRFENPSKQGLLYMMSSENRLPAGDGTTQSFPPHLMFHAPNMTTKDIGFESEPKLDYLGTTDPGAADNLLVVVPTPPTPQAASTPDAGPTKENALEAAMELAQAMRTNDPDGFCRLLDPDWAIVDGFGEIQEDKAMSDGTVKKDICAAIRNGTFTRKTYDMDFANARVRIYGNIATVTAKLSLSGPSGHNNPPGLDKWSGKEVETDVLKWEDGGWKDILTHETNVKDTLKIEKNPEK